MAQLFTPPATHRGKKVSGAPRRFISTLKSRRRGVFVAAAFILSVIVVAFSYRLSPQEQVTGIATKAESAVRTAEVEKAAAPAPTIIHGEPGKCFRHILYDKPVKTGSTAIAFSIKEYLHSMGERDRPCGSNGVLSCTERAKALCNGTIAREDYYSVVGHVKKIGNELVDCLRPTHYVVTSIREPFQRRKSAYLWNRTVNGTHFNIPHTAPFKEFMDRMPRCQLYDYYDGKGGGCTKFPIEQRAQDIIDRVDEVIDLYDSPPVGQLHNLIAGYIGRENESIKIDEKDYIEEFDRETLKEEQFLYDRLREKRLQPSNPDRLMC